MSYHLEVKNEANESVKTFFENSNDGLIYLVAEKLNKSTSYSFTITTINSIGQQSTAAVPFCKKSLI